MTPVYLSMVLQNSKTSRNTCFTWNGKKYIFLPEHQRVILARCPHAGADLAPEDVINSRIVCPLHHYKFDIHTGSELSGQDYRLPVYKVMSDEKGAFFIPK